MRIFLHMLGGDAREWDALRALLPGKSDAIDLPGHGIDGGYGTQPPRCLPLEQVAEHVLARIGSESDDPLALVGTSAGGAVAARIAAMVPSRIASLTLISTALTRASTAGTIATFEANALGRDYDARDLPLPRDAAATASAFAIDDPIIHAEIEASRANAGGWIKPLWRGVAEADVIDLLARTNLPTQLIYGEHDPYRRFLPAAAPAIGTHEIALVTGAGSFPHRTHPKRVAALISR